jgi:toxin ParE1/3/4
MTPKARGYRLYPRALRDLEDIYDYTIETWSRRQAEAYVRQLSEAFGALASGRRVGRDAELGDSIYKLSVGAHIVFYQANEVGIDVVRILHQAMDVERHLRS